MFDELRLTLALKGAVTAALLGFLIQRVDLAEIGELLLGVMPLWVVIGLLMGPPMVAVSGLRWRDISGYLNVPLSRAFAVLCYFEGTTFNIFLPGAVGGDILRATKVTRARGKLRRNIAAVAIDRVANLAVILLLCLTLLFFSSLGPETNELIYLLLALATAVALGFVVLLLVLRFRLMRRFRVAREIVRFSMIFSAVLLRADRLARIAAWSSDWAAWRH